MGKLLRLVPHPAAPPDRACGVVVRLAWPAAGSQIAIEYRVEGAARLVLPPRTAPERGDRLWEATCFELFVRSPEAVGYFELNFSPSGRWAAYAFDSHRHGMRQQPVCTPPSITTERHGDGFTLRAWVDVAALPRPPLRVGISVIVEEEGGRRSYWALAHPPDEPDFHHPDCFVLDLPPPDFE